MKYGFIGCGNMGGAIARALSKSTKEILVTDRSGKAKALAAELGIGYADAETIAKKCDRIFLAVKPHLMQGVLEPLRPVLAERKPLLITMAAGLEIRQIEAFAGGAFPVIRIMPNTPTAIGKGVIQYCCNDLVTDEILKDWLGDMSECGLLDAREGFSFQDFSLDMTTFEQNGRRYCIWAEKVSVGKKISNLYIAELSDALTMKTPQMLLSSPTYAWERHNFWVNEGPAILRGEGKIFVTYSASDTSPAYCMGMLWMDAEADPMDISAWHKLNLPVLKTDAQKA